MIKGTEQEDLLKKLASKAKRKLNKEQEEKGGIIRTTPNDRYVFIKRNQEDDLIKLEKKIVQIIKNNPDCTDPIGRLIDHSVYDELNEEQKQSYIFKLSKDYKAISEKLKAN